MVGGTGMLADLTPQLIERGYWVTVIGRSPERLESLLDRLDPRAHYMTPLAFDYHDDRKVHKWVEHVQLMQGPFDLVVAWLHEPRDPVLRAIGEEVVGYRHDQWRLLDLRGIRIPSVSPRGVLPATCRYQRVQLGYQPAAGGYRWLTHQEIVSGVLKAVDSPHSELVAVGHTELPLPDSLL